MRSANVRSGLPMDKHRRQEPFLVAHKTVTKPSTFVKFVIKFEGAANPTHNLSLCSPHNGSGQG
jgi:hypothetical protein